MVTAKGHGLTAQSVGRRNLPKTGDVMSNQPGRSVKAGLES
jgi:hypothetical protein